MYDIIGDIHGHADKLVHLLEKMDYREGNNSYEHKDGRKIVFVGDYIDKGPKILETLRIVKSMVDNNQASAIMGNHEFNAIAYHTKGSDGQYLRRHSAKNYNQHKETLIQMQEHEQEWLTYIDWFKSLPLFLEKDGLRFVHACWDDQNIAYLKDNLGGHQLRNIDDLAEASDSTCPLYRVMEETLKGKEYHLPKGYSFQDKYHITRTEVRTKWWLKPSGILLREYSVTDIAGLSEVIELDLPHYAKDNPPVFFGHYWLVGTPKLQANNVCCLDYSVAKEGHLVAYRYHGESSLLNDHFVCV